MNSILKIRFMRHVLAIALGAFVICGNVTAASGDTQVTTGSTLSGGEFRLKHGDRVAFFGDSITAQDLYTTMVANHYLAFRPELNLTFKNAGVGGDQLEQGLARLDRDLVSFKPTVITCFFGMNDAGYVADPDDPKAVENLKRYNEQYRKLLGQLREKCPGARIVLFTTTPVDPKQRPPMNLQFARYNELLGRFSEAVRQLGAEEKLPVVELFTPMKAAVERAQSGEKPFSLIPDSVHPGPAGHFLMAQIILKAWGE